MSASSRSVFRDSRLFAEIEDDSPGEFPVFHFVKCIVDILQSPGQLFLGG